MATQQHGYLEIKDMILCGKIPMGERIIEARLAEQLGISRTPVREALRRLTSDRLVEFHPRRSYRVVSYSAQDVAAIYSCRALLESEAVRLVAASGLSETAATLLTDIIAQADEVFGSELPREDVLDRFLKLNNIFHGTLYGACPNPMLRRLIRTTTEIPMGIRNYFHFSDAELEASHAAHKQILRAILNRETERAGALMREHIWTTKDRMNESVEAHGGGDRGEPRRDTDLRYMPMEE